MLTALSCSKTVLHTNPSFSVSVTRTSRVRHSGGPRSAENKMQEEGGQTFDNIAISGKGQVVRHKHTLPLVSRLFHALFDAVSLK